MYLFGRLSVEKDREETCLYLAASVGPDPNYTQQEEDTFQDMEYHSCHFPRPLQSVDFNNSQLQLRLREVYFWKAKLASYFKE